MAFLGPEGLYCCEFDGKLLWKQNLGVINISKYGIGWGFAGSLAVHDDRIVVLCDDPNNPFLAARRLDNGEEIWRIKGGGDNPVPTPFEANGLIYITNAHGGPSPIYAVRPSAKHDITSGVASSKASTKDNFSFAWRTDKGGSYRSTPIVYGNQIYGGTARGLIRSFQAGTGEKIFERRLGIRAGMIASLVAGDGKIYCAAENGTVYVLKHGLDVNIVGKNAIGDPCLATPAISKGTIFLRTTKRLIAIKNVKQNR